MGRDGVYTVSTAFISDSIWIRLVCDKKMFFFGDSNRVKFGDSIQKQQNKFGDSIHKSRNKFGDSIQNIENQASLQWGKISTIDSQNFTFNAPNHLCLLPNA